MSQDSQSSSVKESHTAPASSSSQPSSGLAVAPNVAADAFPQIKVRAKFLFEGEKKFFLKGVTYGPFAPDSEGFYVGNPEKARAALEDLGLDQTELMETKLLSPAQAEKVLKKHKLAMPDDLIVAVSSGDTLATEDDPRPASLQIGRQLAAALSKLS